MMRRCCKTLILASALAAGAAAAADLSGRWEGTAQVPGAPQPLVLDVARDAAGRWTGSVVLPGRAVKGAPLADLAVTATGIHAGLGAAIPSFGAPGPAAAVALRLQADGSLRGEFTQAGHSAPLQLRRSGAAQVDPAPASTPLSAALGGTWTGRYELGGYPRQVTLVLKPGDPGAAELTIVGRRTTQVPIDRINQGPRFITLESGAMGITIEGRHAGDRIDGTFTQGPFELPLVLERTR